MPELNYIDCWITILLAEYISYRRQRQDETLTSLRLRDELLKAESLEHYFTEAEGPVAAELLQWIRGLRQPTEKLKLEHVANLLTTVVFVEEPCIKETLFLLQREFGDVNKLTTFLSLLHVQTQRYWSKPDNITGGNLHCFLDDGNFYDTFFSIDRMLDSDDYEGIVLSSLWIRIPTFLRDQLLRIMSRKFPRVESRSVWTENGLINIDDVPLIDTDEKLSSDLITSLINGQY